MSTMSYLREFDLKTFFFLAFNQSDFRWVKDVFVRVGNDIKRISVCKHTLAFISQSKVTVKTIVKCLCS